MTEKIITRKQFRETMGICRKTEICWRKKGLLPRMVSVNNRIIGYREADFKKWLDDRTGA